MFPSNCTSNRPLERVGSETLRQDRNRAKTPPIHKPANPLGGVVCVRADRWINRHYRWCWTQDKDRTDPLAQSLAIPGASRREAMPLSEVQLFLAQLEALNRQAQVFRFPRQRSSGGGALFGHGRVLLG